MEEDVLRPLLPGLLTGPVLPAERPGPAGPVQGGRAERRAERRAGGGGRRGGTGAAAQLPDLVEGRRLGAELAEEAAPRRRQQDAQAEERGLHEGGRFKYQRSNLKKRLLLLLLLMLKRRLLLHVSVLCSCEIT